MKKDKNDDKNDDEEVDRDDKIDKSEIKVNKLKVSRIIEAFEDNIKMNKDEVINTDDKVNKRKVENAFSKLMLSGGKGSPSPGKKKRKKRLVSNQSQGKSSLIENWMKKEKK